MRSSSAADSGCSVSVRMTQPFPPVRRHNWADRYGVGVILVLNSGSSSVKYWVTGGQHGKVERITDHDAAVRQVLDDLPVPLPSITAVGHRVVHGGARFTAPVLIDDDVIAGIEALVPLAPLHNPGSLAGIKAARVA